MIANFRVTPWKDPLIYYYGKTDCKLLEETLALLPPNFIRHTEKQPGINYIPFTPQTIPFHIKANLVDSVFPEDYYFLRELFEKYRKPRVKGRFLYLSRNLDKAKAYTIDNEDKLLNILQPYNFEVVCLTRLSIKEQIELVSSADIVLAPHGAGMIHILWCDRETSIIELKIKGIKEKRHYSHICWALEMEHKSFVAELDNNKMVINLDELGDYLAHHHKIREYISEKKDDAFYLPFQFTINPQKKY